jgi:hypothetical protein
LKLGYVLRIIVWHCVIARRQHAQVRLKRRGWPALFLEEPECEGYVEDAQVRHRLDGVDDREQLRVLISLGNAQLRGARHHDHLLSLFYCPRRHQPAPSPAVVLGQREAGVHKPVPRTQPLQQHRELAHARRAGAEPPTS